MFYPQHRVLALLSFLWMNEVIIAAFLHGGWGKKMNEMTIIAAFLHGGWGKSMNEVVITAFLHGTKPCVKFT